MKLVDTLRGKRRVDVANKLVENNDGDMVAYTKIVPTHVNGEQLFAYVYTCGKAATALTLQGHKDANELGAEEKAANLKKQAIRSIMSEGYGDY